MTESIDVSPPEPGSPEPSVSAPGPEPAEGEATAETPQEAPAPPSAPAPPAWVAPASSGRGGRCLIGCLIGMLLVFVLVVGSVAGLIFLGGQVQKILAGTIQFGTGGTACSVSGNATFFPATSTIHLAATLKREVPVGETVTMVVTVPDGTNQTEDKTFDTAGQCVYQDIPPGLPSGHYILELRSGSEVLAHGTFDITP